MSNAPVSAALVISLAAALPAAAGDFQNSSVTPRELVHCMMKRMKADRSQSYRAVLKACRQDLEASQSPRTGATAMNGSDSAPADPPTASKQ